MTTPSGAAASGGDQQARLARIAASPSYVLAFEDRELLLRDELRANRLELEFLKPELIQQDHAIRSTLVVFGGTRILEAAAAEQRIRDLEAAIRQHPGDPTLQQQLEVAHRVRAKSHYYDEARKLAQIVSRANQRDGRCDFVVVTGGGPGIMEAANRGAFDVGAKSMGLNITLPHEQHPNSYITPELCFQLRYFVIRKMHFMMRARALVVFPGGYGTLDELFEALTLVQTHKIEPLPIILCGRSFWQQALDLEFLAREGTIAPRDLELVTYAETAGEIWAIVRDFYGREPC